MTRRELEKTVGLVHYCIVEGTILILAIIAAWKLISHAWRNPVPITMFAVRSSRLCQAPSLRSVTITVVPHPCGRRKLS